MNRGMLPVAYNTSSLGHRDDVSVMRRNALPTLSVPDQSMDRRAKFSRTHSQSSRPLKFLMTFKEYPQRQKAASFNMDEVLAKLKEPAAK